MSKISKVNTTKVVLRCDLYVIAEGDRGDAEIALLKRLIERSVVKKLSGFWADELTSESEIERYLKTCNARLTLKPTTFDDAASELK